MTQDAEINVDEIDETQGEVIEAAEEAEPLRVLPTPIMPSPSDVEKHRESHIPYASWCDHCVEGRGREMGHHGKCDVHRTVPTVSFDYLFVSDKGTIARGDFEVEGEAQKGIKILVVKDDKSKCVFAHVVPVKGIDSKNYGVDMVVSDVVWMGYTRIIIKSDNEPAMLRLVRENLLKLRVATGEMEQVMEEHPPPHDSQANGQIEAGVKQERGQFKTMQRCLESRIGHRVPVEHPIMAWMAQHAAMLVTYRVKGHDGMTAYQRVRGRPFGGRLMGFGEKCRF